MASHRATRTVVLNQGEMLQKILDNQRYIKERLDYLCQRARAAELQGEDSTLLGLPWRSINDIDNGLSTTPKQQAFMRMLLSPVVAPTEVHYVSEICDALFTPEFRGRVYMRKPPG